MKIQHKQLIDLLQKAYSAEKAAAFAYFQAESPPCARLCCETTCLDYFRDRLGNTQNIMLQMTIKMKERIGGFIIILIIIAIFVSSLIQNRKVNAYGRFVIGHLIKSDFQGSETGWVHYFQYTFNGKTIVKGFGGPLNKMVLQDSVAFIKLLPDNPASAEIFDDYRVPPCLEKKI